jgi:hypothetical protein
LAALREIKTVQLGMKLIESQVVAAADLGPTRLDGATFARGRGVRLSEVDTQRFTHELGASAVLSSAGLVDTAGHVGRPSDGTRTRHSLDDPPPAVDKRRDVQ